MQHEKFSYSTLADVKNRAEAIGAWLPLEEDLSILKTPFAVGGKTSPNRIVLQPMEGSDSEDDGSPGELTFRRYERFAKGGAGLIWFEAVAVAKEARASAHQLYMTEENLPAFQRMVAHIREVGLRENGFAPVVIMQATHSGRYSKPQGTPAPIIAYNNPIFEKENPISTERIVTDDQLKAYEDCFAVTAKLAERAGFDGVDVKCCHRYLANELLSAYTRPGLYGGESLDNRARFFRNAFAAAKSAVSPGFIVTSRMNVYDGFSYPYGFGVAEAGGLTPMLDEAKTIVRGLAKDFGLSLLNITIGNPYVNPHVNRPYDRGVYLPEEHPLTGVSRMMACVSEVQHAVPEVDVIGSAFSYLRQFSPQLAAGMVAGGHAKMAGFGRMAFAYPDFPNDLIKNGAIDPRKVCITCGQCALRLRAGTNTGCVIFDREVYKPV